MREGARSCMSRGRKGISGTVMLARAALIALLAACLIAGCGRKGPLEPPPDTGAVDRIEQKPKRAEEEPEGGFFLDRLL